VPSSWSSPGRGSALHLCARVLRRGIGVALLALLPSLLPADSLIGRAQNAVRAGNDEAAAELYGAWLRGNQGAPGSARVFGSYFSAEQDLIALLSVSSSFLQTGRGLQGAGQQFVRIARLFELCGRVQEARDAYLLAHAEGPPEASLISACILSMEMNDVEALERGLASLGQAPGAAASLLRALAAARAGDYVAARSILVPLAAAEGSQELALKAMWVLYIASGAQGEASDKDGARVMLTSRFPGSPESALVSSSLSGQNKGAPMVVVQALTPDFLAAPGEAPTVRMIESPAAPAVPAEPPRTGASAVQAGSFQMKENADDLVAELAKKGFDPIVREETAQGRTLFRVFAATGLDLAQARSLLAELKKQGFSGFVVSEK
jgi:cell division septation protein DedD